MKKNCCKSSVDGFTLIELLVVVLIIGILAAIALPQYQKAVLKSRYSGLMPIASAVANGQEVYYMDQGNYTSDITKLDIKAPSGGPSANIEVSDGKDARFEYVLATRDDLPGLAYVIYQKHSPQFPDTIMCEANDELNKQATWLCRDSLKGKEVETGSLLGSDWTAYILRGTEGGGSFSRCTGKKPNDITAFGTGAGGTAVCNESTGEWQYEWSMGRTYGTDSICMGLSSHSCSGGIFQGGECRGTAFEGCSNSSFSGYYAWCYGRADRACANSTFSSNAVCYAYEENACADSTFTGNTACQARVANACSGSTFTNGAKCTVPQNTTGDCAGATFINGSSCTKGCAEATIGDGGYCSGSSCNSATYTGTGCCKSCSKGSGKPKCGSNNTWDGKTVW